VGLRLGLAVVFLSSVTASAALAGSNQLPVTLEGDIERSGHAHIRISKDRIQGTPVEKYRWEFKRLTVICDGETYLAKKPVRWGFSVNAKFGGPGRWPTQTAKVRDDEGNLVYAIKVGGRLVSWSRAKGWLRVWGSEVELVSGDQEDCDSDRLRWVATK
jgi:hypothetical protein